MRVRILLLFALTLLPACDRHLIPASCDDSDDRLSEACDPECPQDPEEAILEICAHPDSIGEWEEGPNSCGGWTVRSGRTAGIRYDFERDREIQAITIFRESKKCPFETSLGRPCELGSSLVTKSCLRGDDAGQIQE